MNRRRMYSTVGLLLGLTGLVAGVVLLSWRRPPLGPESGRLRSCPGSPNCVCSQDQAAEHAIDPVLFTGDPQAAWRRLRNVVESMPGTKVVADDGGYLHAEFTTPLLRFVDDLELLLDAAENRIHVRSASRVGRSDLGANRRRVEDLRRRFAAVGE